MLIDASQPVTAKTAHFPGDEPFSCGWSIATAEGGNLNLGWVKTSPHVGTHVDAPFHYDAGGARVGGFALDTFVGPAIVLDVVGHDALDVDALRGVDLRATPRVLFRTQRRSDPEEFRDDFPLLTRAAVDALAQAGVRLVGIDAPSYDAVDAKALPIHHALGRAGIANVENLRLDDAPAGKYELLAAPLAWTEMDAAPLRAVLRR